MNGVRSLTCPLIEEWLCLLNYFPSFLFSVFNVSIIYKNNKQRNYKYLQPYLCSSEMKSEELFWNTENFEKTKNLESSSSLCV